MTWEGENAMMCNMLVTRENREHLVSVWKNKTLKNEKSDNDIMVQKKYRKEMLKKHLCIITITMTFLCWFSINFYVTKINEIQVT